MVIGYNNLFLCTVSLIFKRSNTPSRNAVNVRGYPHKIPVPIEILANVANTSM